MKVSSPYFSIIIPTLNEEKYLPFLLQDLVNQTNQQFEVIIVDGKSKDKTIEKAVELGKKIDLKIIESPKRNVCTQRNLGAMKARSEWLLFMDADNRLPAYFVQGLRYKIDRENPLGFVTHILPDGTHQLDKAIAQVINTFFQIQSKTKKPYLLESMLGIKKSIFHDIGGFNEKIAWSEGGELLARLHKKNVQITIFQEPKYTYSLRRTRKEGTLKALRNAAYLIATQQAGIKLDKKTFQKYYPMYGGAFFDKKETSNSSFEQIVQFLIEKYEVDKVIEKLNQPVMKNKYNFKKLFKKIFSDPT